MFWSPNQQRTSIALAIPAIACLLAVPSWSGAQLVGTTRSTDRVAAVRLLVRKELEANPKASDLRVSRNALLEFAKSDDCTKLPMVARQREDECREAAERLTNELVAKKYPGLDKAALEKEATDKYPFYEKGQKITVVYRASPVMDRTLTGIYRGRQGTFVVIAPKRILMRDIEKVPANKDLLLMFDPKQSKKLRAQHIKEKLERYELERKAYSRTVKATALRMQKKRAAKKNEKNGYVFHDGEWQSLREVTKIIIAEERENISKQQPAE